MLPPFPPNFGGDRQMFNGNQQAYPYPYVSVAILLDPRLCQIFEIFFGCPGVWVNEANLGQK